MGAARGLAWVVVAVTLAAGCSGGKAARKPAGDERAASRYFPLRVGDRWLYADERLGQKQDMEITMARQERGRLVAHMQPAGVRLPPGAKPEVVLFEARPRGIFDGTRYVLEEPVAVGHKWMAIPSLKTTEHFEVVALDAVANVPAGRFKDCALVRATVRHPKNEVVETDVTFCPGVGVVERVVRLHAPGRSPLKVYHGRLKSFESGGVRLYPRPAGE
jgi:hypothetical protein